MTAQNDADRALAKAAEVAVNARYRLDAPETAPSVFDPSEPRPAKSTGEWSEVWDKQDARDTLKMAAMSIAHMVDEWTDRGWNDEGRAQFAGLVERRLKRFWPKPVAPTAPISRVQIAKTAYDAKPHRRFAFGPEADPVFAPYYQMADAILARLAQAPRLDYYPSHEALHDLVMLRGEEAAIGGGPSFKDRLAKAWRTAEEIFEP